jgi:hypothetical protein
MESGTYMRTAAGRMGTAQADDGYHKQMMLMKVEQRRDG